MAGFWADSFWHSGFWAPGFWAGVSTPTPPAPAPPPTAIPAVVSTVAAAIVQSSGEGGGGGLSQDIIQLIATDTEEFLTEEERRPKAPAPVTPPPAPTVPKAISLAPISRITFPAPPTPPEEVPSPVTFGTRPPLRMAPKPPPVPPPPPPKRRPVILCTEQWGGLGLALLMQRQGADVLCAFDYAGVDPKERECTELLGDGLVEKLPLARAMRSLVGEEALWVFDANDFPKQADALRARGEEVIGTSAIAHRLEDDRKYGAQIAEEVGFRLPESQSFSDYDAALQYLEANSDRAFCYKPDAQDPTSTYVPMEKDDPPRANLELREYLQSLKAAKQPKFLLQEVVIGTEVNFELWVHEGRPLAAFCDLEAKRKLVGDLGENVGCAGDFVFQVPLDSPGIQATVAQYLSHPALQGYTGSVDANVMVVDGEPLFLENCFRFGYNAYPVIFQALAQHPMEAILRAWVAGDAVEAAFHDGVGASLSLVVDHPKRDTPILIPKDIEESIYLYRAYQNGSLGVVEGWPEIACAVALGESIPAAGNACLELVRQVGLPDKGYRVDLTQADLPTLPLARYHALREMDWVPAHEEEDEVESAVLAFLATVT